MQFVRSKTLSLAITAAVSFIAANQASAALVISEVDAAGSASGSGYSADWFELTNTGSAALSIAGWEMDDNHDSFASAVDLTGVTSIAAGQSVVFIESTGSTPATVNANFEAAWFGKSVPATLTLGNYSGGNVGLSQSGDAVNIYNASGTVEANVAFGASSLTSGTFDNTAGLNNVTLTQFSVAGVNGAFKSANGEIGSPGIDTAVTPVPLPAAAWFMMSALGGFGAFARKKRAA
jgi:Lamin Tail Domain